MWKREKWTQEGIKTYNKLKCLLRDCGKEVSLVLVTFHVLGFFFPLMSRKNNNKLKYIYSYSLWFKTFADWIAQQKVSKRTELTFHKWIYRKHNEIWIEYWPSLTSGSNIIFLGLLNTYLTNWFYRSDSRQGKILPICGIISLLCLCFDRFSHKSYGHTLVLALLFIQLTDLFGPST